MADPFIGAIHMFGFNFPPRNWALCNGQIIPINQNQTLYSLLGTTFGGNGRTNFALPDMRGRTPVHQGDGYMSGERMGEENVTLSPGEMAAHTHIFNATSELGSRRIPPPDDNTMILSKGDNEQNYSDATNLVGMNTNSCSTVGGGQAHHNIQPLQVINFCIALEGTYPPRN